MVKLLTCDSCLRLGAVGSTDMQGRTGPTQLNSACHVCKVVG